MQNDNLAWKPPEIECVKINFDGSFCSATHNGGIRVVIHDWRGSFVCAKSDWCFADSTLIVECRAARLAFFTAHDLGFRCLVLESDSLEIISLLFVPFGEIPWSIAVSSMTVFILFDTYLFLVPHM